MPRTIDITDVTQAQADQTVESVLEAIKASQLEQQQLYGQLNTLSGYDGSVAKQQAILDRVHRLSTIRGALFGTLEQMYQRLGGRVATTRGVLADQITVTKVMEQQLAEAERSLDQVVGAQDNKMRMVEINTYYADKYKAQTGLMQLIIIVALIFLVLVILMKRNIVPANVGTVLLVGVSIVGVLLIGVRVADIGSRSNMVFDEYSWEGPPGYVAAEPSQRGNGRSVSMCVNGLCCGEGTQFIEGHAPNPSYCAPNP